MLGGDGVDGSLGLKFEHGSVVWIGRVASDSEIAQTVALNVSLYQIVKVVVGERECAHQHLGWQKDEDVCLKFEWKPVEHGYDCNVRDAKLVQSSVGRCEGRCRRVA